MSEEKSSYDATDETDRVISTVVKAVIFDLDGTLAEFSFDWVASRNSIIWWLGSRGYETGGLSPEMRTQEIFDIAEMQAGENTNLPPFAEVRAELVEIVEKFELESAKKIRLIPGVAGLLKSIRSRNKSIAVVTNNGKIPADIALEKSGLKEWIDVLVTRDDVTVLKPYPEGILKALSIMGLEAEDAVYVGDTVEDVRAAKAANVRCVAVSNGRHSRDVFGPEKPDFFIEKTTELASLMSLV